MNLQRLFGDCPEAEIKGCEILVQVVEADSESRFKIRDRTATAYLQFKQGTTNMKNRLIVGSCYKLFSIEKINQNTLAFSKTSYLIEDTSNILIDETIIDTTSLLNKQHNQHIYDTILLKVLKVYEQRQSNKGIKYQKVLVGDSYGSLMITFWRDNVSYVDKMLKENKVYSIRNFLVDDWSKDREASKPKDITFMQGKTIIKEVVQESVPESFKTVEMNQLFLLGKIKFVDRVYEYKSCPGKENAVCGKTVKPGQTHCSKSACAIGLSDSDLVDDYVVTLVLFDNKMDAHPITAFKRSLSEFEVDGDNIREKLSKIIGKNVKANISKSKADDNPILLNLEFK